jgi:hypothetical protein
LQVLFHCRILIRKIYTTKRLSNTNLHRAPLKISMGDLVSGAYSIDDNPQYRKP